MKKHALGPQANLEGHSLIHNKWDRAHILQFVPSTDGKWVTVTSWNVSGGNQHWVQVYQRRLKAATSRSIWKDLRSRGYRVMENKHV